MYLYMRDTLAKGGLTQICKSVHIEQVVAEPITTQQNFRLVQIETNCIRHFKVHVKWKISTI